VTSIRGAAIFVPLGATRPTRDGMNAASAASVFVADL
jgi:hypothetical protein